MPLIRRATPDDIPGIQALEQQGSSAAHWPAEEYEKLVSTGIVLVAKQGCELCGFVCAKPLAGDWELENIVVGKRFLRCGVADALMCFLLDHSLGVNLEGGAFRSNIFLEVRESNFPARRLYEKHGFSETGRRRNYYQNPAEDAVLYSRSLP